MRLFRVREYLFSSLWFVPLLCVLAGVALSFGTIALDRLSGGSIVPKTLSGDSDAALSILQSVAVSMVTLTAIVLTITMVVVQLAMGQFTPRVLRTILRDRPSQLAIGIFVATFAHAMLVMREVRSPTDGAEGHVPGLAIVVAYILIVICIMVLVLYVNHIGQALRPASLIDSVGDETRALLDKLYPAGGSEEEPPGNLPDGKPRQVIATPTSGVVYRVDYEELMEQARRVGGTLVLVPQIGDFVPEGAPVLGLHGVDVRLDEEQVLRSLAFGKERSLHQDFAYGLRMLVDVAGRSASATMGDPTTAVQAIDRLHNLLRQLVTRPFPSGRHYDAEGRLRLVVPTISWDGYVHLAMDELRRGCDQSLQLTRRLEAMIHDLLSVAPPERRPPLEHQRRLLEAGAERDFDDLADQEAAIVPDEQGIGSGADRIVAGRQEIVFKP